LLVISNTSVLGWLEQNCGGTQGSTTFGRKRKVSHAVMLTIQGQKRKLYDKIIKKQTEEVIASHKSYRSRIQSKIAHSNNKNYV
jgi:hypothetical protein